MASLGALSSVKAREILLLLQEMNDRIVSSKILMLALVAVSQKGTVSQSHKVLENGSKLFEILQNC